MTQTSSICRFASMLRSGKPLRLLAPLSLLLCFTASQPQLLAEQTLRQTATVRAIQQAEPAVVNIEGNKPGNPRAGDAPQVNGMGAGVIIDSRGYILTNQHVVQDVGRIEVTLSNGRQYIGRLIDRDANTDLAMIKIDSPKPLPVIKCGTSSDLMLGEPVIAIGNPYGYHHTVTEGIISSLKRDIPVNGIEEYPDLIQTDASINPGNSGGPLLNAVGEMIGINAAVRIGAQGIGFAIPVDRAIDVAARMIQRYRSRTGSGSSPLNVRTAFHDGQSYVRVSGSSKGDLREGDVITAISNRRVANRLDFELALLGRTAGTALEVDAQRDGTTLSAVLTLGGTTTASTKAKMVSTQSVRQSVYDTLGIQLEPVDANIVRNVDSSYEGGLRITGLRGGSPAQRAQLQSGDILIGLLDWTTPNWKDLTWIMNRPEIQSGGALRFYIIRNRTVLQGSMDL